MEIVQCVSDAILAHNLVSNGQIVVAGVSGGPDSLCLAHVLLTLQRGEAEPRFGLRLAHLNHNLRGAEAQADAEFVAGLAREWGVPCTIEMQDVRQLAAEGRLSLEEAAREARYAFLLKVAQEAGAERVAVAHNADDQAETVLMHFLRGSGVAGLRGMGYKSQIPIAKGQSFAATQGGEPIHLIRPLLDVPRADIEDYCKRVGLQPRFDRSNLDTTFFRNRLRHEVLPMLEAASPGARERLRRMAEVMAGDYETLERVTESARALVVTGESGAAVTFDLAAFRSLPVGLQRALLRGAVGRLRGGLRDIPFSPIDNAVRLARDGQTGAAAELPGGLRLTLHYNTLRLAAPDAPPPLPDLPWLQPGQTVAVTAPGVTPLPGSGWALHAERGAWPLAEVEANTDAWEAVIAWDEAAPPHLQLRTRQPGDRFQPLGMGGHAPKLKDFMIAEKVPQAWRARVPLLASASEILWVCGWRLGEAARVRANTTAMLRLRFVKV